MVGRKFTNAHANQGFIVWEREERMHNKRMEMEMESETELTLL